MFELLEKNYLYFGRFLEFFEFLDEDEKNVSLKIGEEEV